MTALAAFRVNSLKILGFETTQTIANNLASHPKDTPAYNATTIVSGIWPRFLLR
jgi:hypothetical protein